MASKFLVKFKMRQRQRQSRRRRQRGCTGIALCNCSAILCNWQKFSATACKHQFFCATLPGQNGFLGSFWRLSFSFSALSSSAASFPSALTLPTFPSECSGSLHVGPAVHWISGCPSRCPMVYTCTACLSRLSPIRTSIPAAAAAVTTTLGTSTSYWYRAPCPWRHSTSTIPLPPTLSPGRMMWTACPLHCAATGPFRRHGEYRLCVLPRHPFSPAIPRTRMAPTAHFSCSSPPVSRTHSSATLARADISVPCLSHSGREAILSMLSSPGKA